MKLSSPWVPRLNEGTQAVSERLTDALMQDILAGRLQSGDRLPAQRDVAWRLKISVGSVTKAYAALQTQGLARAESGRGVFVASTTRESEFIDLAANAPPKVLSDRLLSSSLKHMASTLDAGLFSTYAPAEGRLEHRAAVARWISRRAIDVDCNDVFVCNGGQHAVALACALACPGAQVLTEEFAYPAFLKLARLRGYALKGVSLDDEGMAVKPLERALTACRKAGMRAVVAVTPAAQNPTGATMGTERRKEIAALCRAYDALIIEDDVYALFAPREAPSLASLAPERVFYIGGLSKALSPGLRIGWLAAPPAWRQSAMDELRVVSSAASPLSCFVMERWLNDGSAERIGAALLADVEERRAIAHETLGRAAGGVTFGGFHAWAPLPLVRAEEIYRRALEANVKLPPPKDMLTDPNSSRAGLRLALGAVPHKQLRAGLQIVRDALT